MTKITFTILALGIAALVVFSVFSQDRSVGVVTEAEFESVGPDELTMHSSRLFSPFRDWKRPEGPIRVGLQVGHWKTDELPEELRRIRERGGGTSGGGKAEWEVNLAIARETAKILEEKDVTVDILPATVPPSYWADAFVAIHADGSTDARTSGFKAASNWRDFAGTSRKLVSLLEEEYAKVTGMQRDTNITHNMRGYYVFNWWRHEHAIHPMTAAAIIETGFLTSPADRKILIGNPGRPAEGIAKALFTFLGL